MELFRASTVKARGQMHNTSDSAASAERQGEDPSRIVVGKE